MTSSRARAAAIALALAILFLWPVLANFSNWGIGDWDQHAFYHEAGRVSLLRYGQLPQWNPYYCGGTDLLANPQSRVLGPTYPIVLSLGAVHGLKIEWVLYAFIGLLGMYALGRDLGLDPLCAWIPPVVYFLGPVYALPVSTGMTWITATAYIPWAVLAYRRAFEQPRALIAGGACLALMFLGGGVYPLVITMTFLGFYSLLAAFEHGVKKTAGLLAALVAVTLVLGAIKFFPSVGFMREYPRLTDEQSGFSLQSLSFGLFHHDQRLEMARTKFDGSHYKDPDRFIRGISSDFDDVGTYIGPVVAGLFLIGLIARGRASWKLAAAFPVFLCLSFGGRARPSLFLLLHELPIYESMRYAERFRFIWLLILCVFAGFGLQGILGAAERAFPGRRLGTLLATTILVLVAADLFAVTRPIYAAAYRIPPPSIIEFSSFRQIAHLQLYNEHGWTPDEDWELDGSWSSQYPALLMNLGTVDCYESAYVPRRAAAMGTPAYHGEAYLEGDKGTVTTTAWSPNRLVYALDVREPSVLVVNQNYYKSWRTADGRPVRNHGGLIGVEVNPGDRTIELRYRRTSFWVGSVVSAIGWMGAAWMLTRRRSG